MNTSPIHSFHIPVLGLGFSVDTPVKVARFGISSVISIMDDELLEKMREHHAVTRAKSFEPIGDKAVDYRAKRITAYLNLVKEIVDEEIAEMQSLLFDSGEMVKYFELLADNSPLKALYHEMSALPEGPKKEALQQQLRRKIVAGAIDVNIMAKVDRMVKTKDGKDLPSEYSDALSALRGFAKSNLSSSLVLSAGYNPRLYSYLEEFADFFPDKHGVLRKKIILKVSDYRSALIQGKLLAKKGLWISEFRIESGLNCGGHAFATEGMLLGPILENFKQRRLDLFQELLTLCNAANATRGRDLLSDQPQMRITGQGGIGTQRENEFLMEHYELDGTGWGSPFLLVPEATNVDSETLNELATAEKDDYYLSHASPLGVPFNNFRKSSSERQRQERIAKGRPGSPCYKKFLSSDTEFGAEPICTSSREYQNKKLKQLKERELPADQYETEFNSVTERDCLCEGLGASSLLNSGIPLSHKLSAVTICPGPNLAYFSGVFPLSDMVGHIYGRINLLNSLHRPNMFVNELYLYVDYLKTKFESGIDLSPKQLKYIQSFKSNLLAGIDYYKNLLSSFRKESSEYINVMKEELEEAAVLLGRNTLVALPALP